MDRRRPPQPSLPIHGQKHLTGLLPLPFRGRFQAVLLQNVSDRAARYRALS